MSNYNTDTKTKLIVSGQIGAPELLPAWGSLNTLLKTLLVEGFNTKTILSLVVEPTTKLATAKVPLGHGYITNDVILITGADQPDFNKEFRIVDFRADEVIFVMPSETTITEATTTSSITCKIAPLGYSLAYENTTEGVICFKNTSIQTPAILKVIDKIPPNGYVTTWAKFARVVGGQEIDSTGEFIEEKKFPYHYSFPDAEKTGNRVSGNSGVHGFAKWDYGIADNHSWAETAGVASLGYKSWQLIGDDKTFYLMVKPVKLSGLYNINGFGLFKSENKYDTANIIMQAREGDFAANTSGSLYNAERSNSIFPHLGGLDIGNYIYSNIYNNPANSALKYKCRGLYFGSTTPWNRSDLSSINPVTGDLLTSPIYIEAEGLFRGTHRGISMIYGASNFPSNTIIDNTKIVLEVRAPVNSNNSTGSEKISLLFSLKDWEEVP